MREKKERGPEGHSIGNQYDDRHIGEYKSSHRRPSQQLNSEQNLNESASSLVREKREKTSKSARKTRHKRFKQTSFNESITGVNPSRSHGFGWYGNPRVVMGVRVDELLKKQFVRVAKVKFGSVCRPIEAFMASIVSTAKAEDKFGVNPSLTVDIGKLVIERNVRTRRKMIVDEETEVTTRATKIKCEWRDCTKDAEFKVFLNPLPGTKPRKDDLQLFCCEEHMRGHPHKIGYRPLGAEIF